MDTYKKARDSMILSQLQTNEVTNTSLLEAMKNIPREIFVPENLADIAYIDSNIEIQPSRYMLSPMVLAKMIQEINSTSKDLILDVGCLTGYSTAILAKVSSTVVGLDPSHFFVEKANKILSDLQIDNAAVLFGNPLEGCPSQGPYNKILINGSIDSVPLNLIDQLVDGGKLICIENKGSVGKVVCFSKQGQSFGKRSLFDAFVPLLPGVKEKTEFVF